MKQVFFLTLILIIYSSNARTQNILPNYTYKLNVEKVTEAPRGIKIAYNDKDFQEFGKWNLPAMEIKKIGSDSIVKYNWFAYKLCEFDQSKGQGYQIVNYENIMNFLAMDNNFFANKNDIIWSSKENYQSGRAEAFYTKYKNLATPNMSDGNFIYKFQTEEGYYAHLNQSREALLGKTETIEGIQNIFKRHFPEIIKMNNITYLYWKGTVNFTGDGQVLFDRLKDHSAFGENLEIFDTITEELNNKILNWAEHAILKSNNGKYVVSNYQDFDFYLNRKSFESQSYSTENKSLFYKLKGHPSIHHLTKNLSLPKKAYFLYESASLTLKCRGMEDETYNDNYPKQLVLPTNYKYYWIGSFAGLGYEMVKPYCSPIIKYSIWGSGGLAFLSAVIRQIAYNKYQENPIENYKSGEVANFWQKTAILSTILYSSGVTIDLIKTVKLIRNTQYIANSVNKAL